VHLARDFTGGTRVPLSSGRVLMPSGCDTMLSIRTHPGQPLQRFPLKPLSRLNPDWPLAHVPYDKLQFVASVLTLKFAEINTTSLRSRRQHKAWGVSPQEGLEQDFEPARAGGSGHAGFPRCVPQKSRMQGRRSVARCRGLLIFADSDLGFRCAPPQALRCRLLRRLNPKSPFFSELQSQDASLIFNRRQTKVCRTPYRFTHNASPAHDQGASAPDACRYFSVTVLNELRLAPALHVETSLTAQQPHT
jgi:hypothetical protein